MRGLAALSSWWVLNGLALGLLLTLLALRRLRQLIVSFALAYLMVTTAAVVAASIRRPRPFGVAIRAGWGGCVQSRLPGWTVANVAVNDGRSVITFDHDRAGAAAVVMRLAAAACETNGTAERPSQVPGVRRFERVERLAGAFTATWYDRFLGGCVSYRLHSTTDPTGQFANEAPQLLGFTTREQLRQALAQRSHGQLQLDPAAAR